MGPITLLPIIGIALYYSRRFEIDGSLGALFSVSTILLALYVAALVGGLRPMAFAIHIGGALCLANELRHSTRRGFRSAPPASLTLIVLLSCAYWWRYGDTRFFFFDEYSHWGIYLKEMLARDNFWGADTNALHVRYVPGTTLFQYLFNRITVPSEGNAYLAQFVLLLTPTLLLLHGIRWRQWPWVVGVLALGLLVATRFSPGFSSIYVDHVLGAWFAGALLAIVLTADRPFKVQALCALPVATLALIKGTGFAFALAAVAIMAVAVLLRARSSGDGWRISAAKSLRVAVVVAIPAMLCMATWSHNRDQSTARLDAFSPQTMLAGSSGVLAIAKTETGRETTRRFVEVVQHSTLGNNEWFWSMNEFTYVVNDRFTGTRGMTTIAAVLLFVGWWLTLLRVSIDPEDRRTWSVVAGGLLLTALAYVASLYVSYLFAFAERGVLLPSYTRYMNTLIITMLLVSFAPLLPGFRNYPTHAAPVITSTSRHRESLRTASLLIVGLAGLYAYEKPPLQRVMLPNPPMELRRIWEPLTQQVSSIVGSSRIWVYLPDDRTNGFMAAVVKYLLSPARVHVESSSAFWRQDATTAVQTLSRFDYLWITAPVEVDAPDEQSAASLGLKAGQLARIGRDARGRIVISAAAGGADP
jgi:hypothetical protein